jgi:hypothetical protein
MSQRPLLTLIDWPRYQRLSAAAASAFGPQMLAERIRAEVYEFTSIERDLLQAALDNMPKFAPEQRLPLEVRRDPNAGAQQMADFLQTARTEEREFALLELSRVGEEREFYAPHFLLLSYFSEMFRLYALGLEGDGVEEDLAYDGPMALLRAAGGLVMPGHPIKILYEPTVAADISRGLNMIVSEDYPKGDVGSLRDYFEDSGPENETLDDVCRGGLAWLLAVYATAASAGNGIRIIG